MQTLIDIQESVLEYIEKVEKNFSSIERRHPYTQRLNYDLDKVSGTLPTGKLTLVSGTDNETREIFLSWLALRLGYDSKLPVVCAFNCSAIDLTARLISMESKIPLLHLASGMLLERQDWPAIVRAAAKVQTSGIMVAAERPATLDLLVGQTAALAKNGKPGVLIFNSAAGMAGAPEEFNSLAAKYGILIIAAAAANLPRHFSGQALKVYSYPHEDTMSVNVFGLIHGAFVDWGKNPQKNDSICVWAPTPD